MKFILFLLFLVSCNSDYSKKDVQYLTNGYVCDRINAEYDIVGDCENPITGQKQEVIYNATNITEVK